MLQIHYINHCVHENGIDIILIDAYLATLQVLILGTIINRNEDKSLEFRFRY